MNRFLSVFKNILRMKNNHKILRIFASIFSFYSPSCEERKLCVVENPAFSGNAGKDDECPSTNSTGPRRGVPRGLPLSY